MHRPRREQPLSGNARGQNGRLGILGQRELILGAFETEAAQGPPKRGVRFRKYLAADGKGCGQRLSHADCL
jgi:hypothetical protein